MICAFFYSITSEEGLFNMSSLEYNKQLHQFLFLTHPILKNKMLSFCWFNEWKDLGGYMAMEGF